MTVLFKREFKKNRKYINKVSEIKLKGQAPVSGVKFSVLQKKGPLSP
jgi:hypothetical protein